MFQLNESSLDENFLNPKFGLQLKAGKSAYYILWNVMFSGPCFLQAFIKTLREALKLLEIPKFFKWKVI